jgi:hypothetical protein
LRRAALRAYGRGIAPPTRYLVELRPPKSGFEDIQSLGADSRAASEELSRSGTPVRFLRSVFVPEDGSCLLVFEAESDEAVRDACRLAAIVPNRVSEALDAEPRQEGAG